MIIPVLNIIHVSKDNFHPQSAMFTEALKRDHNITAQAHRHKFTYGVWDGIRNEGMPFKGISQSHKQIVQHAKDNGLDMCFIAEDDFQLMDDNSWTQFMCSLPQFFDLFMAGISGGKVNEETKEVTGFSGLFLYCIHSRFYDVFLSADEEKNIDRWLSGTGLNDIEKALGRRPIYKVCYPMAAITYDGLSLKSGEYVQHDKYFSAYKTM